MIDIQMENNKLAKGMLDLGASINLMSHALHKELDLGELKPTNMTIQMANRMLVRPLRIIEDALIRVDTFMVPVDLCYWPIAKVV